MKPTVLAISGPGRSGSTLLELLLGGATPCFCAGEVTHLWGRGIVDNQLCGCGVPLGECPFWTSVLPVVLAKDWVDDAQRWQRWRDRAMRLRRIPRILRKTQPGIQEYSRCMEGLYRATAYQAETQFITDSSKYPPETFFLLGLAAVDTAVIHLVRDSRAVVFSWQRRRRRPEIPWETAEMPRYSPLKVAVAWVVFNRLTELACHRGSRSVRVRYEDLVADPSRHLQQITSALDVPFSPRAPLNPLQLGENHTISGNPLRFKRGPLPLHLDDEWQTGMSAGQFALVTLVTAPWLRRYGYAIRPSRAAHCSANIDRPPPAGE